MHQDMATDDDGPLDGGSASETDKPGYKAIARRVVRMTERQHDDDDDDFDDTFLDSSNSEHLHRTNPVNRMSGDSRGPGGPPRASPGPPGMYPGK